ncbi:bacteriocin biosynthesis cyclodehydratase domain-containing protein [Subtercola boreus]|nr:bacteriocin biosynthesis cyclodehydratase domain-containing protein [Subtercola boreus]
MRTDTGTGTGTLRLDPRFPVVWRSPTCLQIGVDRPRALFPAVSPAEERMLHALARGVTADGLRMIGARSRGGGRAVARLLDRVAPALLGSASGAPGRMAGLVVSLSADSPAAAPIAQLFGALGAEVVPGEQRSAGEQSAGEQPAGEPRIDLAVIVSSWFTPPAEAAAWLRDDVPHVDVVFSDAEVTIGPFVTPGTGACLHCRERYRIDSDGSWPAIAGQLLGRSAPTEVPLTIARAVPLLASFCLEERESPAGPLAGSRVLHLDALTGAVSETRQGVHPECACRALPGTSTGRAPGSDSPRSPPTRASAAGGPG